MANVQFGSYAPSEEPKDDIQYVYYTREGEYLGGIAGSAKIYITTKDKYDQAVAAKKWETVNDESQLVKYDGKALIHADFRYIAYIVSHESGNADIKELRCVAFTSHNRSVSTNKTWRALLASGYSSVPNKKELPDKNDDKSKLSRYAVLDVCFGVKDITDGAEFWDGTDFLAWGNSETNPYNKLGQNKFDEYKFVEIPKNIYDEFVAANGTSARYKDKGNHDDKTDKGTHEHITKKIKKPVKGPDGKQIKGADGKPLFEEVDVPDRIKYAVPSSDFSDQKYWAGGNFYYETGVKTTNGISATITAGKSIFWKITPTSLTASTPK
ncbi:hypothetical protein ASE74_24020 [Pedobacter sp. Leaf216]|uniref:hypothetical protein n=1 Tax=Pedobacter sp. Leaf216 TaxID=1735684 RepID=UPI0006FB1A31|nr:hypothetical protein [Pedobacter sp. Leaf216]KQM68544.1 hypothetical protein ASE74_24020 [Pedobacter sp. Leaf216]